MEISNAVLAEKIDNLQVSLDRMEKSIDKLDGEQRQSELDAIRDNTRIENKADAANVRIDKMAVKVSSIEMELPSLIIAYRIMATVGSVLGISVIGLIWALITGQAHISFGP